MTIYTVTLTGDATPFEVYGGLAACDHYLRKGFGEGRVAYRAKAEDDRESLLADATQWIDDILAGLTPTGAGGTALQVPAEDVTNADGTAMSDADQLAIATRATFEAVAILAADPDAAAATDTGSNIRTLDADGAKIEFFRPTSALDGTATILPSVLTRILARLLVAAAASSGGDAVIGGSSNGTCRASSFDDCDAYDRTEPF